MSVQETINDLRLREQTPEVQLSLERLDHPFRPRMLHAREALESGQLELLDDGMAIYRPQHPADIKANGGKTERLLYTYNTFSQTTMEELAVSVVNAEEGVPLREEFEQAYDEYMTIVGQDGDDRHWGDYAVYLGMGHLTKFAPERLHRMSLIASNSTLLQDPQFTTRWEDAQQIFENIVVAGVGGSVGSDILEILSQNMRFLKGKAADPKHYKTANADRVHLAYHSIALPDWMIQSGMVAGPQKNKAQGTAERIQQIFPAAIWAYADGVTDKNIEVFLKGNGAEPPALVVCEACDDPKMKIEVGEWCRKFGIREIRLSDMGSYKQIDVRPFDLDKTLSLCLGVSDDEVYARYEETNTDPGKESFGRFLDAFIGTHWRRAGEFGLLMTGKLPRWFTNVPQLGGTAFGGSGDIADMVPRMALGHKYPERRVINMITGNVINEGKMFGGLVLDQNFFSR